MPDIDRNHRRGVLGKIGIAGKNRGHRLADVADAILGKHRLTIGLKSVRCGVTKIDRRQMFDIFAGPDREHAFHRARRLTVDSRYAAVRNLRPHNPHVQLPREIDVVDKTAAAAQQRLIFQTRQGAADDRSPAFGIGKSDHAGYALNGTGFPLYYARRSPTMMANSAVPKRHSIQHEQEDWLGPGRRRERV